MTVISALTRRRFSAGLPLLVSLPRPPLSGAGEVFSASSGMRRLAYHTDKAREVLDDDIVAAVPIQCASIGARGLGVGVLSLAIDLPAAALGPFGPMISSATGRLSAAMHRQRRDVPLSEADLSSHGMATLVFRPDRIDVHARSMGRTGELLGTFAIDELRIERQGEMGPATLSLDETTWILDGWLEKDVTAALKPLGLVIPPRVIG